MSETLKNILIIKPSSLGDIIQALPALTALRKSFPGSRISWLVRTEFASMLENHPHLTDIIPFDRKFLGKAWYYPPALGSLISFLRSLKRPRYDAVFDLQGLFRTAFFAWSSRCGKRYGMADARELAALFYTHKIPRSRDCIHLVDYYLKIIRSAGASVFTPEFILPCSSEAADSVSDLLEARQINPDNYAVLVPGSAHSDKCWPSERFAALAEKISAKFGFSIIATGAASESDSVEILKTRSNVPLTNLAGRTSLRELIALMRNAKLVISNDTGPGHIAAALGRPLVLIFGRSNPARVCPYARDNCTVAIEPDRRGMLPDSLNPKHSINNITTETVFQKVCEQMNS